MHKCWCIPKSLMGTTEAKAVAAMVAVEKETVDEAAVEAVLVEATEAGWGMEVADWVEMEVDARAAGHNHCNLFRERTDRTLSRSPRHRKHQRLPMSRKRRSRLKCSSHRYTTTS